MHSKDKIYYIDISTLSEKHFTGVSRVAQNIAKYFIEKHPDQTGFFYGRFSVNKEHVKKILDTDGGEELWDVRTKNPESLFQASLEEELAEHRKQGKYVIGIHTFIRMDLKKYFDFEYQIIHDLTPFVTPQFHVDFTIRMMGKTSFKDTAYSDMFIADSQSTKQDMITYWNIEPSRIKACLLGTDFYEKYGKTDPQFTSATKKILGKRKFVYTLGTIEPRKNIQIILEYLDKYPDADDYYYVFTGAEGWGLTFSDLVKQYATTNYDKVNNKVKYLGFVSNQDRLALLKNAEFTLTPSFYEGFGLPLIESMAMGTPVLSSLSSSLPEVGEDLLEYFDPTDFEDLVEKMKKMKLLVGENRDPDLQNKLIERAKFLTWERFCKEAFFEE